MRFPIPLVEKIKIKGKAYAKRILKFLLLMVIIAFVLGLLEGISAVLQAKK